MSATENWKGPSLPLARIKKIMKSEEAVFQDLERERLQQQSAGVAPTATNTRFMIAGEAPVLLGKACELMVRELTVRAWRQTERNRRRTLQRQDMHTAVGESEVFDFLIDLVPRVAPVPQASGTSDAAAAPPPAAAAPVHVAAAPSNGQQPSAADPQALTMSDAESRYAQLQQMQEHYNMVLQQQQRMQADGGVAAPGAPPPGGPVQQVAMMMNPQYMIQPPQDSSLSQVSQWGVPAASNTNEANPAPQAGPGV